MKRYREVVLASPILNASALARLVEAFADQSSCWEFPKRKSLLYEKACERPSCCVIAAIAGLPRSAIHVTRRRDNSVYVANIIPLDSDRLTLGQYNTLAAEFARAIRAYAKQNAIKIAVRLSKADVQLADVVPGRISKKLFAQYMAMYPLSHHPFDIARLDAFICSLSRYGRKQIDVDAFETLLAEELGWSSTDAKWCRLRVEIGLEILTANRIFVGNRQPNGTRHD